MHAAVSTGYEIKKVRRGMLQALLAENILTPKSDQ
jgi:hypothetical protein